MAPEVRGGQYSYQADIYSLGLTIWEVAQLICQAERRRLFYKLLDENDESAILDHVVTPDVKQLIITKRNVAKRTKSLDDALKITKNWFETVHNKYRNRHVPDYFWIKCKVIMYTFPFIIFLILWFAILINVLINGNG